MNITRRNFLGGLIAAMAIPPIGFALPKNGDDWFEDLKVDRYYTLQGGMYKDTGGWGCPYPGMGNELLESMRYWEQCRELEDKLDVIESRGFYLSQSQYFGKPYRQYDRIPLTKRWMLEFYRRHKDDRPEDWQKRYDDHYDALRASGWTVTDDHVGVA